MRAETSAYKRILQWTADGISLIYIKNRGLRIGPCGTQHVTVAGFEMVPPISTDC